MFRNFLLFVNDIIVAINKIRDYLGSMSCEEFRLDSKTCDAVMRNLEIIGEGVNT